MTLRLRYSCHDDINYSKDPFVYSCPPQPSVHQGPRCKIEILHRLSSKYIRTSGVYKIDTSTPFDVPVNGILHVFFRMCIPVPTQCPLPVCPPGFFSGGGILFLLKNFPFPRGPRLMRLFYSLLISCVLRSRRALRVFFRGYFISSGMGEILFSLYFPRG